MKKAIVVVNVPHEEIGKCLSSISSIIDKMEENGQEEFFVLWKLNLPNDNIADVEEYIFQKIIKPKNKQVSLVVNEEHIREQLSLPLGTLLHFFMGA
jgi:methylmalonyl-CoA mutase cobalamin-binding subunit